MIRDLECSDLPVSPQPGWLNDFVVDFQGTQSLVRHCETLARSSVKNCTTTGRLVSLLSFKFRELPVTLALSLLRSGAAAFEVCTRRPLSKRSVLSMRRLSGLSVRYRTLERVADNCHNFAVQPTWPISSGA